MKVQELLDLGVKKVRKKGWPTDQYLELPGTDTLGERYPNALLVIGEEQVYFSTEELYDEADDWDSIDQEKSSRAVENRVPNESIRPSFEAAKNYRLKFGPQEYIYKTLDEIASRDAGLRFLDRLVAKTWLYSETREMIKAYLKLPAIKKELEDIT